MKLLFDQNLSYKLVDALSVHYPESTQVRLIGLAQADDQTIWQYAKDHSYTIVTKDADFYEYSLVYGSPPKIIWLKCGNTTTDNILNVFQRYHDAVVSFLENKDRDCLELY